MNWAHHIVIDLIFLLLAAGILAFLLDCVVERIYMDAWAPATVRCMILLLVLLGMAVTGGFWHIAVAH